MALRTNRRFFFPLYSINWFYVVHLKSSAHCACAASRMMQSFWFSRQMWARRQYRTMYACWQSTWSLFCKTIPWNGRRTWLRVRSRAVTSDHTLTRRLIPQVQDRKFWKSMDGKCFPIRRTVLTWVREPLTCSQNWRNHSVGNASEALRRCLKWWPE